MFGSRDVGYCLNGEYIPRSLKTLVEVVLIQKSSLNTVEIYRKNWPSVQLSKMI